MESDVSLIFLPGNHSLDSPLLVENCNSFRMGAIGTNSSDSTIIECKYLQGFNLEIGNVIDVRISGLLFIGCSSSFHCSRQVWITGCTFSSSQKTALKFVDSTAYVTKSLFSHNEGGGYQLERNSLATAGGAIFANMSTITIVNSSFHGNSAENGGAIYCHCNGNNTLTLLNSTFTENAAAKCKVSRIGTTTYYGSVVYSKGCKVLINDSTFQNNLAAGVIEAGKYVQNGDTHHHGGVMALFKSSVSIHHSSFTHNRATKQGGVIFSKKSKIASTENDFYHNEAQSGGVIRGTKFKFSDRQSNFSKNEAHDVAGVLYCSGFRSCTIIFIRSVISLNNATKGNLIEVVHGRISIVKSIVTSNFVGIVTGRNTQIEIINSEFANNLVGGLISMLHLFQATQVQIVESNFINNSMDGGRGAVLRLESDHFAKTEVVINGSRFTNNSARVQGSGGVISYSTFESNIVLVDCHFDSNSAESKGGVLYCDNERISHISIDISNCTFHNNSAEDGGVLYATSVHISISQTEFKANRATVGAVMFLSGNGLVKMKDVIIKKNVASSGTMYMMESRAILSGNLSFSENLGSYLAYGSIINFTEYTILNFSNSLLKPNALLQEGGAITAFQSEITFYGKCMLSNNTAIYGGAIHATESKLYFFGEISIKENRAAISGGGIYLQQSEILSNNSSVTLFKNTARNRGGGIHAIGSSIRLDLLFINIGNIYDVYHAGSLLVFVMNKAKEGGGLYLESNAKLYILRKEMMVHERFLRIYKSRPLVNISALTFTANSADYGGAIYVADNTNSATCTSVRNQPNSIASTSAECFFQVLLLSNYSFTEESVYLKSYLRFENNIANISAATLYGGLLDRCTVSPFANKIFADEKDTLSLFTKNNDTDSISSAPVRVCFCAMNEPDCSYQPPPIKIKKGQKFNVTVAAVDQVNHTVQNVTIRSSLYSKYGGLGENQLSQITTGTCTDLHYEIFSPNASVLLIMYAEGPCKDALPSQRRLEINFLPCSCQIGFQPSSNPTRCTCECDPQLNGYIADCHPQTGDVVRKGNYWIAYLNTTSNSYLVYPNCPLDYCLPVSSMVIFNLNTQDGINAQCTNHHSGKLCGPCKPGHTLSLGSSRCIPCPNYWPALLITILVAALLGGILLIAAILIFNLTVAVGILNGVIFYANIIHANANVFLPFRETNFITMFIAWLNLELGFD
jgi:predicted outer membrane repeat protein